MSYTPMKHLPTPEQQAILDAAKASRTSLMITAYAGCAKTTTMEMVANSMKQESALALAFNVKIKKELELRFPKWFEVKTMNGLGHGAWQKAIGKRMTLDETKMGRLTSELLKSEGFDATTDQWNAIRTVASKAMHAGLVPSEFPHVKSLIPDTIESWMDIALEETDEPSEMICTFARAVLCRSVREAYAGTISFDDQIYMSSMFGGVFPRHALVMVDEAQDLSPLNHIQVRRTAADRLMIVGDPKQAIYQFRGADSESMGKLRALRREWIDLPLATTFRCPKAIVARQQHHAPGFTAAPPAPQGTVKVLEQWEWSDITAIGDDGRIAVLCRNNAPLLSFAFKLIRRRIGCYMLGRDIGKGLVALSKKLTPEPETPIRDCIVKINNWKNREIDLAIANGKENKVDQITDKAECLLAVIESGDVNTAGELRSALESLFSKDSGLITLSTGHRAKGLEWETVLHLDPQRLPSHYAIAKGGKALEQEKNLLYVIETRAKSNLVMAKLEEFKG